jgi:hypothetical protein
LLEGWVPGKDKVGFANTVGATIDDGRNCSQTVMRLGGAAGLHAANGAPSTP